MGEARVLIAGLGQVGLLYDLMAPGDVVYSHARACAMHSGLALVGGVDADADRRALFSDRYSARAFDDVGEAVSTTAPDAVVVATPTDTHLKVVAEVLAARRPAAILCEKPLGASADEAARIVRACEEAGVALFVNYMRCVEPGAIETARRIHGGTWQGPWAGTVWYTRGFRHNASHFWVLAERWFGPVTRAAVLRRHPGAGRGDALVDVRAEHGAAVVHYLALADEGLSHHALEAIGRNGRLRYDHGGRTITWEPAVESRAFPGHVMLTGAVETVPSDFNRFQWHVAAHLAAALAGDDHRLCSGAEALASINRLALLLES